ncbi:sugar ABC transporter ATP-binding protein [Kribbella sp. CA-253562]|uniref:sugar ABC transporter ATP-binding protein n=1 Tax=Kribbella sp. CA-253562 TaxID=3239942 RepID=UPI003D91B286
MGNRPAALEVQGLTKSFGAQVALHDVDLRTEVGQIHAVLGENGAGKSTLIKILAGVHKRDAGRILLNGSEVAEGAAGLAFVHQDLGLIDTLSVAENVALETGYAHRLGFVSHRRTEAVVAGLLAAAGVDVDPRAVVAQLPQDQKVMVAVARALSMQARVVVLDEVSASLPAPDMARLSVALRASRANGVAYVLVTHRLDEVFDLADHVTVLRDGRVRASVPVADTTHEQIVAWIVGEQEAASSVPSATGSGTADVPLAAHTATARGARHGLAATPGLQVRDLVGPGLNAPIRLTVEPGEILGICGLIGSGTRALAGLLGGATRPVSGSATLGGARLPLGDSRKLRHAGCAFVPGDRLAAGAATTLSIRENLFLARGTSPGAHDTSVIVPSTERRLATRLATRFAVRPHGTVERHLGTLSGGNQQKVVVGRALRCNPRLLVLEDPTAGVDVGSRAELHRLIRAAAADGAAVVLLSTDFDEITALSDRALVMNAGRLTTELTGDDLTTDRLAQHSYARTEPAVLDPRRA